MGAERSADRARIRRRQQWRKAGGLDTDGTVRHPATGSPPGGVVSPRLANVSLPYARDLWCAQVVTRPWHGEACRIRYADDEVCACAQPEDAERFDTVRGQRLQQCGLELSGDQTRRRPFSQRPAAAPTRGEFLGCALHGGTDRAGTEPRKRRTARQKGRNALKRCTAWCTEPRHLRRRVLCERLPIKRRGYDHSYGVHGHTASLPQCFHRAIRILMQWLTRRSQRRGDNWHGSQEVLKHCKVARPRIVGRPRPKKAVLMAEANMRKQVCLKSPVRENRTPGSVRGRSGNWPSYRDGQSST